MNTGLDSFLRNQANLVGSRGEKLEKLVPRVNWEAIGTASNDFPIFQPSEKLKKEEIDILKENGFDFSSKWKSKNGYVGKTLSGWS